MSGWRACLGVWSPRDLQNRVQDLAFRIRYIRQQSLVWVAARLASRAASFALWLALLPLSVLLHAAGFRQVTVFTHRIGHLALEPDCLLKEQALGRIPRRRWILLAPAKHVANDHLLAIWRPHFIVVQNEMACFLIGSMSGGGVMRYDIGHYLRAKGTTQDAYRIYSEWGSRPPLLKLSAADDAWGDRMLAQLGIPDGAWFVCVHTREAGFSPMDEEIHSHRNSRIENTLPAIDEIVRRGGWVIRIGDSTMGALPPMRRVIDYAHHALKSPRLDVLLCARARFILGNTSGIALVGSIFGVPCALANMIPASTLWFNGFDISIPKLLWSQGQGRLLRIDEMLDLPLANFQYAALYRNAGIVPVENTAEEIALLASEMLDRLAGQFVEAAEDAGRANLVRRLFKPGHYAFGSAASMATLFLRHHADLLPPPTPLDGRGRG